MKYCFGDIVVIEENLIGVIVKSWISNMTGPHYDVYVRMYNAIKQYQEHEIQRYMVRHKYLDEDEMAWQRNAVEGW